jgi:type IX secretion system PorP/SprF family membrane protein
MLSFFRYDLNKPDIRRTCLIILADIVLFIQGMDLQAQDIHFSQFYAGPLLTNPANTGMSGEDIRIANIYRNQWPKVGVPYETFCTSVDKKLNISGHSFGIGGIILHDQSSSFNLSANEFMLSVSYSKIINNQQFTIGLQSGLVYKSFNITGLTFNSQFNQTSQFFDVTLPTLENGLDDRLKYFDMNAGISWRTLIHNIMPSAGISISHVNTPVEKFSTSSTGIRLPMKLNFNGGVLIPINNRIDLNPGVLYSYTPGAHEFLLGSVGDYAISRFSIPVKKLFVVTMFRLNPMRDIDALIFGGGAEFLKFNMGITYDFNISPLHKATNFNGAFEVSLIYTGKSHSQNNTSQPCYIIY